MSKKSYKSDIILGEKYKDEQTGFEGVATGVFFYQHACERICLETYDGVNKKVIEFTFDAPRLTSMKTGKKAQVNKTGGPERGGVRDGSLR